MQPLLSLLPKNKKFVPQADQADVQHSIRPASWARAKAAFVFTVRKERREGSQDRVVAGLYHITELCSSNHHKVLGLDPITAPGLQSPCEKCRLTPRWSSSSTTSFPALVITMLHDPCNHNGTWPCHHNAPWSLS